MSIPVRLLGDAPLIGSRPPVVSMPVSAIRTWTWYEVLLLLSRSRGPAGSVSEKRLVSHLVVKAHQVILEQISDYLYGLDADWYKPELRLIGRPGDPVVELSPWVLPVQKRLDVSLTRALLAFTARRMPSGTAYYYQLALASYLWRFLDGPLLTSDREVRDTSKDEWRRVQRMRWFPYGRRGVRH